VSVTRKCVQSCVHKMRTRVHDGTQVHALRSPKCSLCHPPNCVSVTRKCVQSCVHKTRTRVHDGTQVHALRPTIQLSPSEQLVAARQAALCAAYDAAAKERAWCVGVGMS